MAIQNRRGAYTNFDPTKMLPGEYAIVLSGDPSDTSGYAVYMCFASGVVKRLALDENVADALDLKQDELTFDNAPTANSPNVVSSGVIYNALSQKQGTLTFDASPTQGSMNPVRSGGVYQALGLKEDKLTFDTEPTQGSTNPVTSGGINQALSYKQNNLTFDSTPTASSTNPVTSGGIKSALTWSNITNKPAIEKGTGTSSIREGTGLAGGNYSHAEGNSVANGNYSHSEGSGKVYGQYGHADGENTLANGYNSSASGSNTIANGRSQHVVGEYNVADGPESTGYNRHEYVEIVGIGTSSRRRNGRTLDWNGNEVVEGSITSNSGVLNLRGVSLTYTLLQSLINGNYSFTDPNNDGNIVIST